MVATTLFAQTRDGQQRVELPHAASIVYTQRLNQPGECTFTLPAEKLPDAQGRYTIPIGDVLEEGVHEIGIRRGDSVVWLGPATTVVEILTNTGGDTLEVAALGLAHYPHDWHIEGKLPSTNAAGHFVNVDQATIVKAMLDHHQAKGGGDYADLDTSGIAATGVTRIRREYDAWRRINIGEAIDNLANVANGFDYSVNPETRAFRIHYPRRGRRRDNVTLNPANVLEAERMRDSTPQASSILGSGDGFNAESLRRTRTDSAAVAKYGLTQRRHARTGVTDPATLLAHLDAELAQVRRSRELITATCRYGPNLPYGSFEVGDELRVEWPRSAFRPIDSWMRVIGTDTHPHPDEVVQVHLEPIGA